MSNTDFLFTNRMNRIMRNAEIEAHKLKARVIKPVHLLIACLHEKGGAMGELILHADISLDLLREAAESLETYKTIKVDFFTDLVTEEVAEVFGVAVDLMKRYNQIFVNEGHLLKALITTKVLDAYLSEETERIILTLGTTTRDMITHLGNYIFPEVIYEQLRKTRPDDEGKLVNFVEENFSDEWAATIKGAFLSSEPTVYVALDENDNFIGFAAFDVYQNKKGYFGPMGVVTTNRTNGTGYALLHHCLKEMKEVGYEYAIIGGAGPIEFYEKACKAVVIPAAN